MNFQQGNFYHIYNRANSENDLLFIEEENYSYFLKKYRKFLEEYFETICYCLIPNHFHFLVRVREIINLPNFKNLASLDAISNHSIQQIKNFLICYTKSFNKKYNRKGSLFQKPTKSKIIDKQRYLQSIVRYIHRNPIKHKIVERIEDWRFSSYPDYIGIRNGTLPAKDFILKEFDFLQDFRNFTELELDVYKEKFEKYIFEN